MLIIASKNPSIASIIATTLAQFLPFHNPNPTKKSKTPSAIKTIPRIRKKLAKKPAPGIEARGISPDPENANIPPIKLKKALMKNKTAIILTPVGTCPSMILKPPFKFIEYISVIPL